MIFQVILVQLIVAGIILFVLKTVLEHELLVYALECLEGFEPAAGGSVKEVTVLVGRVLSDKMMCRLQGVIRTKFPSAESSVIVSKEIGGGAVVEIDGKVMDFSLAGRLKHLWGQRTE